MRARTNRIEDRHRECIVIIEKGMNAQAARVTASADQDRYIDPPGVLSFIYTASRHCSPRAWI